MNSPILIHIPHSSADIPAEYLGQFLLSSEELERELFSMTDWYTDKLFDCEHERVIFPISRLVCDVERFRNDEDEEMVCRGMGVIYTQCSYGGPLRTVTKAQRKEILSRWYGPHHVRLTAAVSKCLNRFGHCLLIDGHSFSAQPLPYEPDQRKDRPDFCIGTDSYHTPRNLVENCASFLRKKGYIVEKNRPFAGTLVPMTYYHRDTRVESIMIEINRGLYMNGEGNITPNFYSIHNLIYELLTQESGSLYNKNSIGGGFYERK